MSGAGGQHIIPMFLSVSVFIIIAVYPAAIADSIDEHSIMLRVLLVSELIPGQACGLLFVIGGEGGGDDRRWCCSQVLFSSV